MLLIPCLVAILGWVWWPREGLLQKATFIARTKDWSQGRRFNCSIGIHWLSDTEVLFDRFDGPQHDDRVIYCRNTHTGKERKLPDLTHTRGDFGGEVIDDQNVSPDGRWFLCSDRWGDCLLAEVNGKRSFTYPSADTGCYRSLVWMADGHHWLENYHQDGTRRLVLHDTLNPTLSLPISVKGKERLYGSLETIVSPQQAIAVIEPEKDEEGQSAPNAVVTVCVFSLDAASKPYAQYRIAVPRGSSRFHLTVSPSGKQIAWQVTTLRADAMLSRLHRFFSFVKAPVMRREEIWVCDLYGSHMHEIGSIVEPAGDDEDSSPYMNVQWQPNGRRVSFQYNDALYSVPAD